MTLFIVSALLLTSLVVLWLVVPLLRGTPQVQRVSNIELNASIYREHLANLEADFANGQLDAAELENARKELQWRLLEDTDGANAAGSAPISRTSAKRTAWILALLIPLGAAGTYWWLGTPSAIDPQATQAASRAQIEQMVANLAAKQKANPDNLQGWAMLGRSYKVLGRIQESAQAYAQAGSFVDSNADLLVEYADVLALSRDSDLQGQPTELLRKALAMDPKHPMALLMAGVSAYQRADFKAAIAHWQTLLAELEPGSEDAQQVESNIRQAQEQLAQKPGKKP